MNFDFESGKTKNIETEFGIHDVYFDQYSDEFIGINTYGQRYLKFRDFSSNHVQNYQLEKDSYLLSGHVTSVQGDRYYYLTATQGGQFGNNCVLLLDKKTNASILGAVLEKSDPPVHDCKFGNNDEELLLTYSDKVSFFNRKTRTVRNQELALATTKSSLRHFSVNPKNEICLQSNIMIHRKGGYDYETGEIVFSSGNKTSTCLAKKINDKIENNEILDLVFDNTGTVFVCSHAHTPFLTVWNSSPLENIKIIEFGEEIVRVSNYFNEPYFLVMSRESFYLVDMRTFAVEKMNLFTGLSRKTHLYGHKTLLPT